MKKATLQQTKIHNKRLVLRIIYDREKISRADVARITGLTRATVSSSVRELIDEGYVIEKELGASKGGKPPILLSFEKNNKFIIGVDLGESEFKGALVNLRGEIIERAYMPNHSESENSALEIIYKLIDSLIERSHRDILGIGIGTPGIIDSERGFVHHAVNLNWRGVALGDLLKFRYKRPVYIANDSQVAALGEFTFGKNKNLDNLVVLIVSRGIGAGIVINRKLYCGEEFGAGELGHMKVVENGKLCRCGNYGCLETVASLQAILDKAKEMVMNGRNLFLKSLVSSSKDVDINMLLKAYKSGDISVKSLITEAGRYLGLAVANLVSILNIRKIVVAGSAIPFGEDLLNPLREEIKKSSLQWISEKTSVEITSLGSDIVILGSASLVASKELWLT